MGYVGKIIESERGFTLAGMMINLLISGLFMTGLIWAVKSNSNTHQVIGEYQSTESMDNLIYSVLQTSRGCQENLVGKSVQNQSIILKSIKMNNTKSLETHISREESHGSKIQLDQVEVRPTLSLGDNQVLAEVIPRYNVSTPSKETQRISRFPATLNLSLDPQNRVLGCGNRVANANENNYPDCPPGKFFVGFKNGVTLCEAPPPPPKFEAANVANCIPGSQRTVGEKTLLCYDNGSYWCNTEDEKCHEVSRSKPAGINCQPGNRSPSGLTCNEDGKVWCTQEELDSKSGCHAPSHY